MSRHFISRREAVALLLKILANRKIEEEDDDKLEDMIHCLEAELENFHEWGADTSEAIILHFPTNSRVIQSMEREELKCIYKKYRFIPSESDKEEEDKHREKMLKIIQSIYS